MEEQIQPAQPAQPEEKKKVRQCPHCGQDIVIKSTWDALWRKPTMNEWIILFMLAMTLFGAWAYKHDIQSCRDFIANQTRDFKNYSYGIGTPPPNQSTYMNSINISNVSISSPTKPDNDSNNES